MYGNPCPRMRGSLALPFSTDEYVRRAGNAYGKLQTRSKSTPMTMCMYVCIYIYVCGNEKQVPFVINVLFYNTHLQQKLARLPPKMAHVHTQVPFGRSWPHAKNAIRPHTGTICQIRGVPCYSFFCCHTSSTRQPSSSQTFC